MRPTPLRRILAAVVEALPGARAGALADEDGETVDAATAGTAPADEHALITAHYAVLVNQVRRALGVFHYGGVSELVILNRELSIVIRTVAEGYVAVLTYAPGTPLAVAQRALGRATEALRLEIA